MQNRWIGLDIGGTKCAAVLAETGGGVRILERFCVETGAFAPTFERLCREIEAMLLRHETPLARVRAIGVSCGGPLDSRRGVILCPPNLPGWTNVPITRLLCERFGIPAHLQNDANACALVEWKLGAGRGTNDMVFLTMGTGMGAGVIAEGRLLRGHADMAGEVGHVRLTEDGPVGYGKRGSFEGWTSGGGIARQAVERTRALSARGTPPQWTRDGAREDELSAKLLAAYALRGDPDALALFDRIGTMLGRGVALLADLLNPECVVIGSIFTRCEALLRPAMERALAEEALAFTRGGLCVVPAQTGEAIGDLASVMAALYAENVEPQEG